jgi:hypothetical protein
MKVVAGRADSFPQLCEQQPGHTNERACQLFKEPYSALRKCEQQGSEQTRSSRRTYLRVTKIAILLNHDTCIPGMLPVDSGQADRTANLPQTSRVFDAEHAHHGQQNRLHCLAASDNYRVLSCQRCVCRGFAYSFRHKQHGLEHRSQIGCSHTRRM